MFFVWYFGHRSNAIDLAELAPCRPALRGSVTAPAHELGQSPALRRDACAIAGIGDECRQCCAIRSVVIGCRFSRHFII